MKSASQVSFKFSIIVRIIVSLGMILQGNSGWAVESSENVLEERVRVECEKLTAEDEASYQACRQRITNQFAQSESSNVAARAPSATAQDSGESACVKATKEAQTECSFTDSKSGKQAIAFADGLRNQIKAMAMSSPVAMCGKMGEVSQTIDIAVGAFNTYCTAAYSDCDNTCSDEIDRLKTQIKQNPSMAAALTTRQEDAETAYRKCKKLSSNIGSVFQNIGSFTAIETAKAQYCQDQGAALAALCKSQPSNALCQSAGNTDCSNPTTAANNIVCICQVNKADARCTGQALAGLTSNLGSSSSSGSSDGSSSATGNPLDDFGGTGSGLGVGGDPVAGVGPHDGSGGPPSSKGQPGRGGGMDLGGSGHSGAGKNNAAAATGQDPVNAKIINGYGAGGSGGARGGYYGSAGSGASAGSNGFMNGKPGAGAPVDLRKFLPGGNFDPKRGLAGISGPDGITGPNTDIWDKVKSRYYNLQPSLLP